mgnify:CR=1 FL=1
MYISGQEAQRARSVLERLVLIVKDNRVVDNDEIEAAIRLSINKSEENINNIVIKTPKKKILPRALTQVKYIDALRGNTLIFSLGRGGEDNT